MARPPQQDPKRGDVTLPSHTTPMLGVIRRVLVFAHPGKPGVRELLRDLEEFLRSRVETVLVETDVHAFALAREAGRGSEVRPDLLVVLGGDGAILGAVRAFAAEPVPTLGINFGRVGFLASTPTGRWREVLQCVFDGRAVVEPRLRIAAERRGKGPLARAVALNDVVAHRPSSGPMGTIRLRVGETWVTDYRADGLILSTPSGSTAYSLSAGGPILEPSVEAMVVTPICSQGLANRPLVLPSGADIRLEVTDDDDEPTRIVVDGRSMGDLHPGEVLRLEAHPVRYPLIVMPDLDPYRRLRDRLGWGGGPGPGAG